MGGPVLHILGHLASWNPLTKCDPNDCAIQKWPTYFCLLLGVKFTSLNSKLVSYHYMTLPPMAIFKSAVIKLDSCS